MSEREKDRRMKKPKTCTVWVLVGEDYIYALTASYTRKEALAIPHERGVTARRATLTLDPPKKRKRK